MRNTRPIVLASVLLLLAAGCTAAPPAVSTPTAATSSSPTSSSPDPTPSPETDEDRAAAHAEALVQSFYLVTDTVRSDHDVALSELKSVATSVSLDGYESLYEQERRDGERQTGTTKVGRLDVQTISLDNSDPDAGRVPTVVVDVCIDIRDVDILDAQGRSIADPDRPDTGWERHHVANYAWDENPAGGWRVASSESLEKKPCSAE